MKRTVCLVLFGMMSFGSVLSAQNVIDTPEAFREAVDLRTSLIELSQATADIEQLEAMADRVLIIDGTINSITIFSEDPNDFYVEIELVTGRWTGTEMVEMHRAYVFLDDPVFTGRLAERSPREPDPSLILRNDHVLVAGQLVSLAEDPEGRPVPVLHGFEIRALR